MTAAGERVKGKVALITGGARGLGEAHARALAAEGGKVVIADILEEQGAALAKEIGDDAIFVALDVTREGEWTKAVAAAEAAFGYVTALINNAGILEMAPIDQATEKSYRRVIDVNQIGPFLGMKSVVPSMRKAGGGSIVYIPSVAGFAGLRTLSAYAATKFALRGMSKSAALDLAADNIRVNTVHPGMMDTLMNSGVSGPPKEQAIKRMGRPAEVAAMVVFLVSDEASFCTGCEYVVDGGFLNVVGGTLI